MVSTMLLATLLVTPLAVLACEGECIVKITQEYLTQYSPITINVLQDMADKIDAQIVPPANRRENSISYFTPVFNTYHRVAYDGLEHAIFPSYFHGKCLYPNGTVPNGCPNPDCPVVCGTPGSMVHFFPVLTRLVFDHICGQLTNITSPKSKTFREVQKMVLADVQKTPQKAPSRVSNSARGQASARTAAKKRFRAIMKEFPTMFLDQCGGWNLSQCTWEAYMKPFILQFP